MSNVGHYGSSTSTSLMSSALSSLAEPEPKLVDGIALDYLLIELVQTLRQSTLVATSKLRAREKEMVDAGLIPPTPPIPPSKKESKGKGPEDDEEEEALRIRLESIGATVGGNVAERLSKDRARFQDTLDTIKFVCKEVWAAVWDKQVDNLRTNHRGVYVLQDNAFRPLLRVSSASGSTDALSKARIYLAFSSGVIRGALARLGLYAVVVPETTTLPQCTFQVKLPKGS
ncbi:Trafficking protein particle complex subunit 33 [Tulasnella sp. 419]|nr:Trafficking protein particle complex subunit 33 [Tulasnella sp. 419]